MYLTILRHKSSGFTLVEGITAALIALYIFLGAWAVYTMVWGWWHEIAPRIEAQRIARLALSSIIDGNIDTTAGTYTIGAATYRRRNGIIGATAVPDISNPNVINFRLEPDSSNVRSFYVGLDEANGKNILYYKDSNSAVHKINSTLGITDVNFELVPGFDNLIKVTAQVENDIVGTRTEPYHIEIGYSDFVFLRSAS